MHPPDLFPFLHDIPTAVWGLIALAVLAVLLYRKVLRGLGVFGSIGVLVLLGGATVAFFAVHGSIAGWQDSLNHPHPHKALPGASNTLSPGIPSVPDFRSGLDATNPLAHFNPWLLSGLIVLAAMWGIGYLIIRSMGPATRAHFLNRMHSRPNESTKRTDDKGEFPLVEVEVGINKETGKPIVIGGKDRFINTMVVGSIGTGKTSRILTKEGYQDVVHIANGAPMDLIVMDPDGGLCASIVDFARENGIEPFIIDLRGEMGSNCALNPFAGGDIADIVDNVRAVLKEQMGDQEGFFQNVQDDLIRTVIQVQVPIWPDTDFIRFADLVTDPIHFRAICNMIYQYAMQRAPKKSKKDAWEDIQSAWDHERPDIERRYDEMDEHVRSMVLSAARSFLSDTRNEQKLEHLEKITKGLKIVVSELATNNLMRSALSKSDLPSFDFESFLAAGKDVPGRVFAVVTGNRPVGNLFGKLFLVTLKMHALARPGNENTRRPVYVKIDEFHRFATASLSDWFAQGRKYRTGITLAIQTRAQLQLASNRGFVDVVEGSCRNKIYFPSPAPADAKYLQDALGSVKALKETHTENKLSFFFIDNRTLDRRITTREEVDPRFRIEDLLYSLTKEEAIFLMTVNNQAQRPAVGYTSFADEWIRKGNRGAKKRKASKVKKESPEQPKPKVKSERQWFTGMKRTIENQTSSEEHHAVPIENATVKVEAAAPAVESVVEQTPKSSYIKASAKPDDVLVVKPVPTEQQTEDPMTEQIPEPTKAKASAAPASDTTTTQEEVRQETTATPGERHQEERTGTAEVIPIRRSLRGTTGIKALQEDLLKTEIQQHVDPLIATRVDLRRRPTESSPVSENSTSAETALKQCPGCRADQLELTPDERKWRCSTCGFEKKNRSKTT